MHQRRRWDIIYFIDFVCTDGAYLPRGIQHQTPSSAPDGLCIHTAASVNVDDNNAFLFSLLQENMSRMTRRPFEMEDGITR